MGPRGMSMRSGEDSAMRNFVVYTVQPNIVRVVTSTIIRRVGHVLRLEAVRSVFGIVTCKPAGKRYLGRPRRL